MALSDFNKTILTDRIIGTMLVVALTLVCVLAGCSRPEPPATVDSAPTEPQQVDAIAQASMNLTGLSADLGQFVSIRRSKPVDFAILKELYKKNLQSYVTKVDEYNGTQLDAIVSQALDQGLEGQNIPANVQRAEKTIQRAFILDFLTSLDRFGKSHGQEPDDALRARIKAAAPVLRAIAERRGTWTGQGSDYTDLFDGALQQIQSHTAEQESAVLLQSKEQITALMRKMLVLSVFYELDGSEKARGLTPDEAVEKLVEAEIYFQSLYEESKKRDDNAADAIAGELAKKPDQADIDLVRSLLRKLYESEVKDIDSALLGA